VPAVGERDEAAPVAAPPAAPRTATTFLILAIAYAAAAHGAFYGRELVVVVVLLAVALVAAFLVNGPSRADVNPATVAAVVLGAWYLVAGGIAGNIGGALPAVELLFSLVVVVLVVQRADARERDVLVWALFAIGAFVALSGWIGVAWRQSPRALNGQGLWRAATTITYPNVAGSLLGALALLALARLVRRERQPLTSLAAFILLTGTLATASRGAVVGLAAGLVVLAVLRRADLLAGLPALIGAIVGVSALLPSMPAAHHVHPGAALFGLIAGALIALLPLRATVVVIALAAIVIAVVPGPRDSVATWWRPIKDGRFTATSNDRTHELHAGLHLVRAHPVAGVGPGNVKLEWQILYFVRHQFHARYVHDEYVQTMVEAGVVGLALALLGFLAIGRAMWKSRHVIDPKIWAGSVSALVALAVQSATDFLWHVAIVPLVATVLVALCVAHADRERTLNIDS
jgi:O-antigen ligase